MLKMEKKQELIGKWLFEVVEGHFKTNHERHTSKLFIKISGMTQDNLDSMLKVLTENKGGLEKYYSPKIRTLKPVNSFDQFCLKDQETIVWLRNNTKNQEALILLINDVTPEAQSLENLFSINEAYLMSKRGIQKLIKILNEDYGFSPEEIEILKTFLEMYREICEPQIKVFLDFVQKLIEDQNNYSITQAIKDNLPSLNLFKDKGLMIDPKNQKRLKNNYLMANLQINSDPEKLIDNVHSFTENREKINSYKEFLEGKSVDVLFSSAIAFVNGDNRALLEYDFELVKAVFNYKERKTPLPERIKEILKPLEKGKEEKEKILNGVNEIEQEENADAIQDFLDDFKEELPNNIVTQVLRLIDRIRKPMEYNDLFEALLTECFYLIDEYLKEEKPKDVKFNLTVKNEKISSKDKTLLIFYLEKINNETLFHFNLDPNIESDEKEEIIDFQIEMIVNGQCIQTKRFKVSGFQELQTFDMIMKVEDEDKLPYIQHYTDELKVFDVFKKLEDETKQWALENDEYKVHIEKFRDFYSWYFKNIKKACKEGIFSLDSIVLENKIKEVLQNIFFSVNVNRYIYCFFNLIGVIDEIPQKAGDMDGTADRRTVTILQPIRLLSFLNRIKGINKEVLSWIELSAKGELNIEKADDYINYLIGKFKTLQPRYFYAKTGQQFIEVEEQLGEGKFEQNRTFIQNTDYLSKDLSKQLLEVTNNYLEIYPHAVDGLDLLFIYCESAEIIIRSIEELFKKAEIKRLRLFIHSTKAAEIHKKVNQWINLKEEFTMPKEKEKFPKIEVNIIPGKDNQKVMDQIDDHVFDADIVILGDYFCQSDQISFEFQPIKVINSQDWFKPVYNEPLLKEEEVKRLPYVSDHLPLPVIYFYQLQYMCESKSMLEPDSLYALKANISISDIDNSLINRLHERFNWIMILDRFLDKSLLQKSSPKAQIIQFKSNAGTKKEFKLIVSSSKYIRKLHKGVNDFDYYGRIFKKAITILKNEQIEESKIEEAVNLVKEISGALIFRAIGIGSFTHELLATYLSLKEHSKEGKFVRWYLCDELPWFNKNRRRPDIFVLEIGDIFNKPFIKITLRELKFIAEEAIESELKDAIKQIKAGEDLCERIFAFGRDNIETSFRFNDLISFLIEQNTFSKQETEVLKKLQDAKPGEFDIKIDSAIDIFCYTTNEVGNNWEKVKNDVYHRLEEEKYKVYLYLRNYILEKLGASETRTPEYQKLDQFEKEYNEKLEKPLKEKPKGDFEEKTEKLNEEEKEKSKDKNFETEEVREKVSQYENDVFEFPERIALKGVDFKYEEEYRNNKVLIKDYVSKIERNFHSLNINLSVNDVIDGASVIRLICHIPGNITFGKIKSRSKDIQLWLGLHAEPNIGVDKNGIFIDIIRENPQTVYFEKFLNLVRIQLQEKVNETNLITPLGLDPLNEVIFIDLSEPGSPHMLMAGTTGSGKSVTINSIIFSIMCLYSADKVKFIFIDPKKVEMGMFRNTTHTKELITEIEEAIEKVESLVQEMEDRYEDFMKNGASNLSEYIELTGEKMERLVIIFDEFADFMNQEKGLVDRLEKGILKLGQKARAAGIHLILCTQTPKAEIINTTIRNNLPARLALRTIDKNASHIIIDSEGAERLGGKGDFLAKVSYDKVMRGKSPFLTPVVKNKLLKYFSSD